MIKFVQFKKKPHTHTHTHTQKVPYLNGRDKEQMLSTFAVPVKGHGFIHMPMAEFTVCPELKRREIIN